MSNKNVRPKWWQLYLTFPGLLVLFALDSRLKISTRLHQLVQISILIIVYGLIHIWLKANAATLSSSDRHDHREKVHVIHIFTHPAADQPRTTMLHLPDAEIKGILDSTYDLDIIDAETYPVEKTKVE